MSQLHYSRRARQHQPYPVSYQPGPSEHVQHTRPYISLRAWVRNLRRRLAPTQSPAIDYRASPAAMVPYPQYAPPAMQVGSVSYAQPAYYSSHDAYQRDPASTVSDEAQDETTPPYPPNITYAPRLPNAPLPFAPWPVPRAPVWTVPDIWTNFKQMELTCPINSSECLLILRDCSHLIEFTFTLAEVERNPLPMVSFVGARALRSLTVKSFCGTERLFQSLSLPQLTSMHLSLASLDEPPTDIGLGSLFSRSRCNIRTLSLINVFLLESELINCLKEVSLSLKELVVRNDSVGTMNGRMISDGTLEYLTKPRSQTSFPDLKTLTLSPCESTDGRLAKMLASRFTQGINFTYSFIHPSLHTADIHYMERVADPQALFLTHLIHEVFIHA